MTAVAAAHLLRKHVFNTMLCVQLFSRPGCWTITRKPFLSQKSKRLKTVRDRERNATAERTEVVILRHGWKLQQNTGVGSCCVVLCCVQLTHCLQLVTKGHENYIKKERKSAITPHPRRTSASAPPERGKEGGKRPATRDEGSIERGRKHLRTRPAANSRSHSGMAASATKTPAKRT
jgi:hypothetical protein